MAFEQHHGLFSAGAKNSGPRFAMAREPAVGEAERDAMAPHPSGPWRDTICRDKVPQVGEGQIMRTQVTLQPGQKGTKKLLAQYGKQLVCVRYRYDVVRQRRLKTIEVIVEETPWCSGRAARKRAVLVGVRVGIQEVSLQRQVKGAGGRWNPTRRIWELRRDRVLQLGLKDRIEDAEVSISRNP